MLLKDFSLSVLIDWQMMKVKARLAYRNHFGMSSELPQCVAHIRGRLLRFRRMHTDGCKDALKSLSQSYGLLAARQVNANGDDTPYAHIGRALDDIGQLGGELGITEMRVRVHEVEVH